MRTIIGHVRINLYGLLWTCVITGNTCRIFLVWVKTLCAEAFRSKLCLGNTYISILPFLYLNIYRSNHSLTRVFRSTCLTMIEHPPLAVYLTYTTMSISTWTSRCNYRSVRKSFPTTAVNNRTTISPRTKRIIAIAISKGIVCCWQSELTLICETTIDKHILILYLTDRRSLEETIQMVLLVTWNHIFYNLCPRLDG